jgi:hypothetical protein
VVRGLLVVLFTSLKYVNLFSALELLTRVFMCVRVQTRARVRVCVCVCVCVGDLSDCGFVIVCPHARVRSRVCAVLVCFLSIFMCVTG